MTAPTAPAKPKPVEPMTPEEQLKSLEQEALSLGMPVKNLQEIQSEGDCPEQIQWRITELREWITEQIE